VSEARAAPALAWTAPFRQARLALTRAAVGAWARRRLALALYLPGALLALFSAGPVLAGLMTLATAGPTLEALVAGDYLNLLVELAGARAAAEALPDYQPAVDPSGLLAGLAGALLLALIGLPLQGLAYCYLSGGVLQALLGRPGSFWGGCRRWFWPLLRLGVLGVLLYAALGSLVLMLLPPPAARNIDRALPPLILLLSAALGLNSLLELARADLVAREDRRAVRALGRALALLAQPGRLLSVLLLWALLALLGAAFWALSGALLLAVPTAALAATFLLQQALALAGAWLKLLRLAVAVELTGAASSAESQRTGRILQDIPGLSG
jgi:hypothetical protein